MTTLTPTRQTGATAKSSEVVYVDPAARISDEQLAETIAADGVDGPFVADLFSAFLTHERCGRHLYRSVAERTNNPMLKRRYESFGAETEEHVRILEDLVAAVGGNPSYVSPAARATECSDGKLLESTFMLSGSTDVMTAEMVMLDAVMLAEAKDQANWRFLSELCEGLPAGEFRERLQAAVAEVEPQEDEHYRWATETRSKMAMLQARGGAMATAGAKAEEMVAAVANWFSE